jgi:hypothetical protein
MTVDTRAYVTVARLDISAGWLEGQLNHATCCRRCLGKPSASCIRRQYHRQVHLGAGHITCMRCICVPRAPNAMSWRGRGIAMEPGAERQSSSMVVANGHLITTQFEGVVIVRLENPLGVENGLVELSPEVHAPIGLYIATTLVRDHREVPARVLNAALCD